MIRKKGKYKMEIKEIINEEYDKFNKIYEGLDKQLSTLCLADIMMSLVNIYKDDKGEIVKDYLEFDKLVENIKKTLKTVSSAPNLKLSEALKDNIDSTKKIREECLYSMRTLSWIKEDVIPKMESEDKDNA